QPHNHPVADVSRDSAIVSVVGSADPGERAIVGILVAIELLPIPVRIMRKRVGQVVRGLRLQKTKRQHLRGGDAGAHQTAAFNEVPPVQIAAHRVVRLPQGSRVSLCQLLTTLRPLRSRFCPSHTAKATGVGLPTMSLTSSFSFDFSSRTNSTLHEPSRQTPLPL